MDREQLKALIERWRQRLPVRQWRDPAPVVCVLRLSGVIGRIGPGGGGMMLSGLERAIDRAFGARHLVAVALAVNSPGGSPVQSALIAGRIRQLAEEKEIPVIAFAEDVAASGGYWLACAADEIFANENSIVGSIGVISAGFGFAAVIDRFGVNGIQITFQKTCHAAIDSAQHRSPHPHIRWRVREQLNKRVNAPRFRHIPQRECRGVSHVRMRVTPQQPYRTGDTG